MKTAYLFPGQGSQYVGMGKDLCQRWVTARRVYEEADDTLGIPLSRISFEGPEEQLRETRITQPALFVHSMAVLRVLDLEIGGADACAAGHSLGEYSAYTAAGSLRFADALRIVRRRGELMYQAGHERPGAMAAILGLPGGTVVSTLEAVSGLVRAANFNSPGQVVISGETEAVQRAMVLLKEAGAKRCIQLEVSGAFHSPLMESAASGLAAELESTEIAPPRCAVLANESASSAGGPSGIRASLTRQLLAPVRWEETMRAVIGWGAERLLEIGAGRVLAGLARSLDKTISVQPLGTAEEIEAWMAEAAR